LQEESKMAALTKNAARLEAVEGVEPPSISLLPFQAVVGDTDSKASLPFSVIVSSDEYLIWDEESAALLAATLSRLTDFESDIILAYGRNREGPPRSPDPPCATSQLLSPRLESEAKRSS
jgi:hypothetical protein